MERQNAMRKAKTPENSIQKVPDCTITAAGYYDLSEATTERLNNTRLRFFFRVKHEKDDDERYYFITTGISNANNIKLKLSTNDSIAPGTVLGCIGVSKLYMNIRPIEAITQPNGENEIAKLKKIMKQTQKVIEPGTIVKWNDTNAFAMWQRDLFFSLLEILRSESTKPNVVDDEQKTLSCEDLSNLHAVIRNCPLWVSLQFSAAVGGGWWETREKFKKFVLERDYDETQPDNKFVLRGRDRGPFNYEVMIPVQGKDDDAKMSMGDDDAKMSMGEDDRKMLSGHDVPKMLLTGKEEINLNMLGMVPLSKAPPLLKQYLMILNIIGNVKSLAGLSSINLSSINSPQQKEGEQKEGEQKEREQKALINEIVSLCPEKNAKLVRTTLNELKNNEGLFIFFHHLLSNTPKGGRPKTRKKRRTGNPRKSRKSKKSKKSKKSRKSRKRKL